MTELTQKGEPQKPWLWAFALVVLTLAVYVPAVGGPFIWDDHTLIEKAPNVRKLAPLTSYLSPFWQRDDWSAGEKTYFRPLTSLSFALDHLIHGTNSGGFHLTNILLHAGAALLLFGLLRGRGLSVIAAFSAGLAWSWFPRLTEAAAWISGRTDIIAGFFTLLGLLLYQRRVWLGFSALCFFFGLLGKEVALAGVLAVAVSSWLEHTGASVRARFARVTPLALVLIGYLALRIHSVGLLVNGRGLSWAERASYGLEAIGRYFTMLLDAWRPAIQLGVLGTGVNPILAGLGGVCAVLAVFGIWRIREKLDAFDRGIVVLFGTSLGLVLHVVPLPTMVVAADRYLYVPTLALVLLVAPRLADWLGAHHQVWTAAFAVYVASFAPITWRRTSLWADEVEFWAQAFREQKVHQALSRLELGNVYARAGLFSRAGTLFLDADTGDYTMFLMARNNAAMQFLSVGQPEHAVKVLEELVARAPDVPRFRLSLAWAYAAQDRVDDARKSVEQALQLSPRYEPAKEYQRALATMQTLESSQYPETVEGQLARAAAASRMARTREAVLAIEHASELGPLPKGEWETAIPFLFDSATFGQLRRVFERYQHQQPPNPVFVEAFLARSERVETLKRLWPSIAPLLNNGPAGPQSN